MATEEPAQPACAGSDTLLDQVVAQFPEEDLRMLATNLQNRLGMSLDGGRRPVAARGLRGDLTRVPETGVPADRTRSPETEALNHLTSQGSRFDHFDHTLAQIIDRDDGMTLSFESAPSNHNAPVTATLDLTRKGTA